MVPPSVNADLMTKEELLQRIDQALASYNDGQCVDFDDFFQKLREKNSLGKL